MSKPNRNDRCPCESGEKFKNCCIDKPEHLRNWPSQTPSNAKALPSILKNDSIDLLRSLSALSILPENHGKNIRLEIVTLEVLKVLNSSAQKSSKSGLRNYLAKEYPSHYLEDPPTNLFTDLVSFHGGDYLIFPGITETGSFILSNLLTAIFHLPDTDLPKGFKSNCRQGILFILNVSQRIASSMGYTRYQQGTRSSELIEFPPDDVFNRARTSLEFTHAEIEKILLSAGIAEEVISQFVVDPKHIDFRHASIEDSPLMEQPIIAVPSGYLVISPTMLSLALMNFIWNQASIFGCAESLEQSYNAVAWSGVQFHLINMGFKAVEHTEELGSSLDLWENLYRFDSDKIAHVRLIAPSRTNKREEKVEKTSEEILSKLIEHSDFKDYQFMEVFLIAGTGQDFAYKIDKNAHARVLAIPLFEFDVLGNLGKSDAIDIWNFATAIDEQLIERPRMHFSFLDIYKVYKEKDDSFYISDDTKDHFIHVQPGYSSDLIFQAKRKKDIHSIAMHHGGRLVRNPVVRKDKYIPVYCNPNDLASNVLRFAVEGFKQPIWVMPNFELDDVHGEFREFVYQLNDAVAFWLSQLCDELKDFTKALSDRPITIRFDLTPLERFKKIERDFAREPKLFEKFRWSASKSEIVLQIPEEIISYLYGSDNEGERCLVKSMLLGFNDLLNANRVQTISSENIEEILNKCAPLGMKKKLFILDSHDNLLLDPRHLVDERRIREYNVNLVLNSIVPNLETNAPPIGDIKTKPEKEKLTRDIVMRSLLPALKKSMSQYDCEELLKRLIELNEALVQQREMYRVNTPSRIACYVSIEQHGVDLMKTSSEINRTTIALRCLMEHVAAEQSRGTKQLSTTGIDELVAMMDQIISWASVGDEVKFDLFDVKMSILKSGRVGTDKSAVNDVLNPYHKVKIDEDIHDAINSYDEVFAQRVERDGKEVPKSLDNAFMEDFKISFTRICELIGGLAIIGFENGDSYSMVPFATLRDKLNKVVTPFSETEYSHGMDFLTLRKRKNVDDIPTGYDAIDISPWRFNRRLSILRKPVIAIERADSKNPVIYWGPRQVLHTRIYLAEQCLSGRLRVSDGGKVIKALGRLAQEKGDALVKKVLESVKSDSIDVHTEVWIGPNEFLFDEKDLGDVDVLIIDRTNKTIYSLECKNLEPSRNIKEMVEEVSKLMGSESEKGLIQKHVQRDVWLKKNKALLSKKYNIDLTDYEVKSFFVTAEGMLTPFLKKQQLALPFVSKYDLEKFGMAVLSK